MRIGFFTDTFLPQTNGVVHSIRDFGGELVKRGHEVTVVAPKSSVEEDNGMRVISCKGVTFKPYPDFKIGLPGHLDLPEFDIIHTHGPFSLGWYGLRVARKQGIPKVSTFHTQLSDYVHYIVPTGKRYVEKLAQGYVKLHYSYYDRVLTPSETTKRMLPKLKVPVEVVPNGIDTGFFKPSDREEVREELGIDCERAYLCLGRLGEEKSIDVVIDAAKDFLDKNSRLYIVGKGPAMKSLQKQAAGNKNIIFTGYAPQEQLPLYYSAADAFITASTSETQGLVVLEAMACGCPVIGANGGAVPEVIKEGVNGYTFKPGDSKQLAGLARSVKGTKKMREAAVKTAAMFSRDKCTDRLESVYDSLITRS